MSSLYRNVNCQGLKQVNRWFKKKKKINSNTTKFDPRCQQQFNILFSYRLSDEVPSVRQTAVTVLTQLVLKDVLKVKGQVSEVAVLLIDPQPHIASLALNFFNELATKVYTVHTF